MAGPRRVGQGPRWSGGVEAHLIGMDASFVLLERAVGWVAGGLERRAGDAGGASVTAAPPAVGLYCMVVGLYGMNAAFML